MHCRDELASADVLNCRRHAWDEARRFNSLLLIWTAEVCRRDSFVVKKAIYLALTVLSLEDKESFGVFLAFECRKMVPCYLDFNLLTKFACR